MALKNMVNNYYNGKPNQPDFSEKDLPKDRLQLFFSVLKVRFFPLITLNLLYILAWVPAAAWTILTAMAIPTISEYASFASLLITYVLLLAPLTILTGPSNMGVSFVTREWARDRHADVFSDFKLAFKANWKQGALLALLNALIMLLSVNAVVYYLQSAGGSLIGYIIPAFVLIAAFIWDITAMILPTMLVTYDQKFLEQLKNAFIIAIAELPRAVLIRLATLIVPVIGLAACFFIPSSSGLSIGLTTSLYIFLMPAFNKLIIASFSNMVCEKYINTKIEGAETNIGLRPEK